MRNICNNFPKFSLSNVKYAKYKLSKYESTCTYVRKGMSIKILLTNCETY